MSERPFPASITPLILAASLTGCGQTRPVENVPDEASEEQAGTPAKEIDESEHPDEVSVTFEGVTYTVHAEPFTVVEGTGLQISVTAEIVDGKEHLFVHDKMEMHHEEPTALRFEGVLVEIDGSAKLEFIEPAYTGYKDTETHSPGDPFTFTRDYPSTGSLKQPVGPDQMLTLTVGIWGTESADGGQRYAPDIASVTMEFPGAEPVIEIQALDPSEESLDSSLTQELGTHEITVKPFYPYKQLPGFSEGEDVTVFKAGETTVRIKEDELVVNGAHYGKLEEDDDILIDHGVVEVAGEKRKGKKLIKAKLLDYYTDPVSEHKMGGYTVLKSPGATVEGLMQAGDTITFILDSFELEITAGKLFVNGVPYGKIKKKVKIKIYFDEIYVGKKKRGPEPAQEP